MKPRISVITIGVADLEKSLAFYRDGLGLPTEGIVGREFEHGAVAFFDLAGGLRLAIWAQDDIAHDTGLPRTAISPTSFTIGHNVARRAEVDEVMAEAEKAGAEVVKTAQDTSYGGYAGYFRDPNGHVWRSCGTRPAFPLSQPNPEHVFALTPAARTVSSGNFSSKCAHRAAAARSQWD